MAGNQGNLERNLQPAMKAVKKAIQLDSKGQHQDAYRHYLNCIQSITGTLLEDASSKSSSSQAIRNPAAEKMVKMVQQCIDRVSQILPELETPQPSSSPLPELPSPPTHLPSSPTNHQDPPDTDQQNTSPKHAVHRTHSEPGSTLAGSSPAHQPSVTGPPHQPPGVGTSHPSPVTRPSQLAVAASTEKKPLGGPRKLSITTLSPMEKAYRENQILMKAYQVRLRKIQGQKNKAAANLTFQRKLLENMAIAKAREEHLAVKLKDRQQKLHDLAAQRFSTSGPATRDDIELRTAYATILEFENLNASLLELRNQLLMSPKDPKVTAVVLQEILECSSHPLTMLMQKYQTIIYQKLLPLVQNCQNEVLDIMVPYKDVKPLTLTGRKIIRQSSFGNMTDVDNGYNMDFMSRLLAFRNSPKYEEILRDVGQDIDSWEEDEMFEELIDELIDEEYGMETGFVGESDAPIDNESYEAFEEPEEVGKSDTNEKLEERITTGKDEDAEQNQEEGYEIRNKEGESGMEIAAEDDDKMEEETRNLSEEGEEDGRSLDVSGESGNEILDNFKKIVRTVHSDLGKALEEGEKLMGEMNNGVLSGFKEGESSIDNEYEERGELDKNVEMGESEDRTKASEEEISEKEVEEDADRDAGEGKEDILNSSHDEIMNECNPSEKECGSEEGDLSKSMQSTQDNIDLSDTDSIIKTCDEIDSGRTLHSQADQDSSEVKESDNIPEKRISKEPKKESEEENVLRLQHEALNRHLQIIVKDIGAFIEKLVSLVIAVYEEMESAVAKEQCLITLEYYFFQGVWEKILLFFRRLNVRPEIKAVTAMTRYQHALPQHIGVAPKFCLNKEGAASDSEIMSSHDAENFPYQSVVEEIQNVATLSCPLDKLECIVRASKKVVECVKDYYESQGKPRNSPDHTVGCDDLLPILSYILIKTALPQIVSECSAMETFIHEEYLFGEEGYCLTTMQTALSYVLRLADE